MPGSPRSSGTSGIATATSSCGGSDRSTVDALTERVRDLARRIEAGDARPDLLPMPEKRLAAQPDPADRLSKMFRLMGTEDVFRAVATHPGLLRMVAGLLGADVDCFLSQFIFKQPGALGQPWHQDDYYFRMTPPPQVGAWLACTAATVDNGPLWVVPGSHVEEIHDARPDPRDDAGLAYVEITDADTTGEQVVLMEPGDLLVFHSRLRHRSTDNDSDSMRAAMVYHYARAASDGYIAFNYDVVPVLRDGVPVAVDSEPVPIDWS